MKIFECIPGADYKHCLGTIVCSDESPQWVTSEAAEERVQLKQLEGTADS